MHRRIAIRNLALILGGTVLLPSCSNESAQSISLKHFDLTEDQIKLVEAIAETIIPKTETLGAIDLNLKDFVFKMLDDCYSKEVQQKFLKGADQFEEAALKKYKNQFTLCEQKHRELMLNSIEKNDGIWPSELKEFYKIVKDETVFGFKQSKYFLTKVRIYEMIPGRYESHYPVKSIHAQS